jgi:hypothetical protein
MNTYTLIVDSAKAREILSCSVDFQRKIVASRVDEYARAMLAGKFLPDTLVQFSGDKLIDGQHRLLAVEKSGVTTRFLAQVHGENEAVERYKVIDQQYTRNFSVVEKVDAAYREGWKIPAYLKGKLGGSVIFLATDFGRKAHVHLSNSEKLEYVFQWQNEFNQYAEIVSLQFDNYYYSASYISLACYLFRHQPQKACDFWKKVVTGEDIKMFNPAAQLQKFILTGGRHVAALSGGKIQHRKLSAAIKCWNAYFVNAEIRSLKIPHSFSTIPILGTPLA